MPSSNRGVDHLSLVPPQQPPDDDWQYSLQVPCDPRSPGVARSTVRSVLRGHGLPHLTDTAVLLTSELVTNAVRYSSSPPMVLVKRRGTQLRVSVWDSAPPTSVVGQWSPHEVCGRGLFLVRQLADDWGQYRLSPGPARCGVGDGKVIWFTCEASD